MGRRVRPARPPLWNLSRDHPDLGRSSGAHRGILGRRVALRRVRRDGPSPRAWTGGQPSSDRPSPARARCRTWLDLADVSRTSPRPLVIHVAPASDGRRSGGRLPDDHETRARHVARGHGWRDRTCVAAELAASGPDNITPFGAMTSQDTRGIADLAAGPTRTRARRLNELLARW